MKERRLLLTIGASVGGIAAAAFLPMAFAHADVCDLGDCTLVSGGNPTDVVYQGIRPLLDDWKDNQLTNVVVSNSTFTDGISGSYDISEQDFQSSLMDNAIYHFGDFTAAADNPTGIDSGGLAGASVYDFTIGPGGKVVDGTTTYDLNDFNVFLANGDHIEIDTVPGEYTNFLEVTANGSGDWMQYAGSSTPSLLWDSLTTSQFPTEVFNLANYLPPDAWFPDIYSMFPPGLT